MRQNVEALIVCPSILKYHWLKEARKGMIGHITAYIYESKRIRYYISQLTPHQKTTILHIINYDILEKFYDRLSSLPFNFFISDECQKIKNSRAERTKVAQALARKAKWKLFITGTPIYNKPKDLFVPLNLIDPEMFSNFFVFKEKYCGMRKFKIDDKLVTRDKGATNQEELNSLLRSNYMIRRMITDVLKDLPEKIKDVIVLNEDDLSGIVEREKKALLNSKLQEEKIKADLEKLKELSKGDAAYETMYKDKVKTLRESKIRNFGEIARIRKELAIKKAPYVIDFVKEMLENSQDPESKIVVFGHHTEVLTKIYNELKRYNPVIITGQVPDHQRQEAISLFRQKNNCRVFVGSMGAAGTGTDGLQDNCSIMVFAELDWTPSLVSQSESRLQRSGQKSTVFVYHIVADDSIDAKIAKMMIEKEQVSKEILDYRPEHIYESLVASAK